MDAHAESEVAVPKRAAGWSMLGHGRWAKSGTPAAAPAPVAAPAPTSRPQIATPLARTDASSHHPLMDTGPGHEAVHETPVHAPAAPQAPVADAPPPAAPAQSEKGFFGRAWDSIKGFGAKIGSGLSSLFGRGRSAVKSGGDTISKAGDSIAANTTDHVFNAIGTEKFDPKVSAESLNWSSRKKTDAGTVQIHDADERRMARAINEGQTKDMLHNPAFNLSEEQRVTLAKNQLLANKLKQSGSGGLYDKDIAKARAAEPVDATAKAGQVLAESSEAVRRVAASGINDMVGTAGEVATGVNVMSAAKHGAMLTKIAGQAALESDSGRQQRAAEAKVANKEASANLKSTVEDYRAAREDWKGKDDSELTDEQKAARHGAVKKNFQSVFAKLKANKAALVANRAAGIGGALDEYKMKHTNSVDGKTGTVRSKDEAIAKGADPVYGMPQGESSITGQIAQGVRHGTEALEFAGKVATGSGAQEYLDKGEHAKAAAISAGGLGTEVAAMAGSAVVPGLGGHGVKTIVKGAGYGSQLVGKLGTEAMNKLASDQDQHDRYTDVMSGARREQVSENPIDFQGAQDMYDPGGVEGAANKVRDAAAKAGSKYVRTKLMSTE